MLNKLIVKNYALIEDLELDLADGFSVITGETGAGKSIILGALSLVLGDRADKTVFRNSDKKCIIEAHFDLSGASLSELFEKEDLDHERISIFRREISPSGRSRSFINDTPVSNSQLKLFAQELINVHSQHHSLEINSSTVQLMFLDIYSKNDELLNSYKSHFKKWKSSQVHLRALLNKKEANIREFDLDKFQLQELEEANLDGLDHASLEEKYELSSNAQEIKTGIENIQSELNTDGGAIGKVRSALNELLALKKSNAKFGELVERVNSVKLELEDLDLELSKYSDDIDLDPGVKLKLEEKLNNINSLMFKHRVDKFEALLSKKEELTISVNAFQDIEPEIERSKVIVAEQLDLLKQCASQLSERRKKNAVNFAKDIEKIISELKMKDTSVMFEMEEKDSITENGKDLVHFKISQDKGRSYLSVEKAASGGELSRIVLAIKAILSQRATLPAIVFDEIDSGVSGEVARKTAEILKRMSRSMQIIAITHLPQVASIADNHFLVTKSKVKGKLRTSISVLQGNDRVKEIAKMLSGDQVSKEAYANAQVLMKIDK